MCSRPCGDVQSAMSWVAHVILVSAQVLLVLTLGLWTLDFGLGLDNILMIVKLYYQNTLYHIIHS